MTLLQEKPVTSAEEVITVNISEVLEPETSENGGVFYRLPTPSEKQTPSGVPRYLDNEVRYFLFVHDQKITYTINRAQTGINKHSKKPWKRWVRAATVTFSFKPRSKDKKPTVNIYSTVKGLKGQDGKIRNITPDPSILRNYIHEEHLPFLIERFNDKYTALVGPIPNNVNVRPVVKTTNGGSYRINQLFDWFRNVIYPGSEFFAPNQKVPSYLTKKMKTENMKEVFVSIFGKGGDELIDLAKRNATRLPWAYVYAKLVPVETIADFLTHPNYPAAYASHGNNNWERLQYQGFRRILRELDVETRKKLLLGINNGVFFYSFRDMYPFKESDLFNKKWDLTGDKKQERIEALEKIADILFETRDIIITDTEAKAFNEMVAVQFDTPVFHTGRQPKYTTRSYSLSRTLKIETKLNGVFSFPQLGNNFTAPVFTKKETNPVPGSEYQILSEIILVNSEPWNVAMNTFLPKQFTRMKNGLVRFAIKKMKEHDVPINLINIQKVLAAWFAYFTDPEVTTHGKDVRTSFPQSTYYLIKKGMSLDHIVMCWMQNLEELEDVKPFAEAPSEWLKAMIEDKKLHVVNFYKEREADQPLF